MLNHVKTSNEWDVNFTVPGTGGKQVLRIPGELRIKVGEALFDPKILGKQTSGVH